MICLLSSFPKWRKKKLRCESSISIYVKLNKAKINQNNLKTYNNYRERNRGLEQAGIKDVRCLCASGSLSSF